MVVADPGRFERVPKWHPGGLEPPVSVAAAMALVSAKLQGLLPPNTEVRIQNVTFSPAPCPENSGHWYYTIDYAAGQSTPDHPDVRNIAAVLLDGSVLLSTAVNPEASKPAVASRALDMNGTYPREYYDGELASNTLGSQAVVLLYKGLFPELDQELDRLRQAGLRMPDGRSQYTLTMVGMSNVLGLDEKWEIAFEKLERWRAVAPTSSNAIIANAKLWLQYAWYARGYGFSNTVSDKGWELYRERLTKARRILEENKRFAATNQYWYTAMLDVATAESWPLAKQRALFDEAVQHDPTYVGQYFAMGTRITPRWGGDIKEFRKLTDLAVAKTRQMEGASMYARMYWVYADTEYDRPFRELGIPWPDMRTGFEDLVARYPSAWNLNHYARFACAANDKATFLKLLPRLSGETLRPDAWPSNYRFETCRETFTTRT